MNATIKYMLSEVGRKVSILAGGDGKQTQILSVTSDSPEFREVVMASKIGADGVAVLDMTGWMPHPAGGYRSSAQQYPFFDAPATVRDVLDQLAARTAELLVEAAAEDAERKEREARLAAEWDAAVLAWAAKPLSERVTQPTPDSYAILHLPMPSGNREVPETHPALVEARAEVERIKANVDAARAVSAQAKENARIAFRTKLGLADGDIALRIENGALANVPSGCWESNRRGKNWLASIGVDPAKPGGLDRIFWDKAKGDSYYIMSSVKPGLAVEFGADYYSGRGRKSPTRWYGFVVRVIPATDDSPAYLVLHECVTGKSAAKEGAAWAKTHRPEPDAVDVGIARVNAEGAIVAPPSVN